MEKKNDIFGMMLMLKKRMSIALPPAIQNPGETEGGEASSHFLIFGIYDGLDIRRVDQWYGMRPEGVEKKSGLSGIKDEYLDKFTIKVYCQYLEECEGGKGVEADFNKMTDFYKRVTSFLEKKKRAEESGRKLESGGYARIKNTLRQNPFITLAMLNLTPEFVRNISDDKPSMDMTKEVAVCLADVAEEEGISLKDLHCAIFPSIGYSDFVIMFLTKNLQSVMYLLDAMKDHDRKNGGGMVSQLYPISGVYASGKHELIVEDSGELRASVRINLRSGKTVAQFCECLKQEGESFVAEDVLKSIEKGELLYHVFENIDCLLLPEVPFIQYLPLFFNDRFLSPSSEVFQEYIESTRTTLRVRSGAHGEGGAIQSGSKAEGGWITGCSGNPVVEMAGAASTEWQERMDHCIRNLYRFMTENRLPVRIVFGIQKVMKSYINLTSYGHCFDIQAILWPAFDALITNINKSIDRYNKYTRQLSRAKGENKKLVLDRREKCLDKFLHALNVFRTKLGEYLADLQRSDKNFLDGQLLSHQSIGSATKLLFFYNQYINQVAATLIEHSPDQGKQEFLFVVISGGNDETVSSDLFGYLDQMDPKLKSLIILTIPEMSLYDVKGTMFRLLHECFHFCGTRFRKERCEKIVEATAEYIGWNIAQLEHKSIGIDREWEFCGNYGKLIKKVLSENMKSEERGKAEDAIRDTIKESEVKLRSGISEAFRTALFNELKLKDKEEQLFINLIRRTIIDKSTFLFLGTSDTLKMGTFSQQLYELLLTHLIDMTKKIIGHLRQYGVRYSKVDIVLTELEYFKMSEKSGRYDKKTRIFVEILMQLYANQLVRIEQVDDYIMIDSEDIPSIDSTVVNIANVIQEVYCDIMAAKLLRSNIEDFLLSFVYECWDIKIAFPETPMNIMRLGLELKLLYGIDGELSKADQKKIGAKIDHWKERGFHYNHVSQEALIHWINSLLGKYKSEGLQQMRVPMEEYLNFCIEKCPDRIRGRFKMEQELYQAADFEDLTAYKMLDSIITYWKMLA